MTTACMKPPATISRTLTALVSISSSVVVAAAAMAPTSRSSKKPMYVRLSLSPISRRFCEHISKLPMVRRREEQLVSTICPVRLTTIIDRETQAVAAKMGRPARPSSTSISTTRMAIRGSVSNIALKTVKTNERMSDRLCSPAKASRRPNSLIMLHHLPRAWPPAGRSRDCGTAGCFQAARDGCPRQRACRGP